VSDLKFSASSFPSHHHHNISPNNVPSLPPVLDRENTNSDIPSNSDGPVENEAEWLDKGHVAKIAKKTPSSKMLEVMAIEVTDNALSFPH